MTNAEIEKRINEMKNVDIRTVNKDLLVDVRTVMIDENLPLQERIMQFINKIGNPYCFRVGDVAVKVEYEDTEITFEQRFEKIIINS